MTELDKQAAALDADIQAATAHYQSAAGQADPHDMMLQEKQLEAMRSYSSWLHARISHARDAGLKDQAMPTSGTTAPADPTRPVVAATLPVDPEVPDPNPRATAAGKEGDATITSSVQKAPVASSGKKS